MEMGVLAIEDAVDMEVVEARGETIKCKVPIQFPSMYSVLHIDAQEMQMR